MRALTLALACLAACADLPTIGARECGNSVIDPGENCDTVPAYAGASCRAPNTIGECHLDCRRLPGGTRAPCPAGWACDSDELCREPSGSFAAPSAPARVGGASIVIAGDFDGDRRGEVVSRSLPNDLGEAVFRIHHFDEQGMLDDTRGFERRVGALSFRDLSGDGRDDIVFPLFGVGFLRGQPDRSLVPETFSPNPIRGSGIRMVSLVNGQVDAQSGATYLTAVDGMPGLYVVTAVAGTTRLSLRGPMHGTVDALAGDPTSASVVEGSPCRELIHGFRGESLFYVSDFCVRDASGLHWRSEVVQTAVSLSPPAGLTLSPQVADLNADGHSDVLLGTDVGPYVAYGDGTMLQTATPFQLALSNPQQIAPTIEMPLAVGELSGDGAPDFVMPQRILASSTLPGASVPRYDVVYRNPGAPWTVAKVDDLTGNGKLDAIAASQSGSGVDFFSGTGTPVLIATSIPTAGPVARFTTGDFDGDTLKDLAFVEQRPSPELPDLINIAYGAAFEPPRTPIVAARIPGVQHIAAHPGIGLTTHVALSSLETVAGGTQGMVTWLFGNPDRVPVSVVDLLTFANNGSLVNSRALALAAGAFLGDTPRDVVALAYNERDKKFGFWLLPELAALRPDVQPLPGAFDARLSPLLIRADDSYRNQVVGLAAQLDDSPQDETAWALPADQGARCAVAIAGLQREPTPLLVMHSTLFFDFPCADPQLAALDVDGDQRRDLVLLGGTRGATDRELVVLWNDGGFERSTRFGELSPQAFAMLSGSKLAFVTSTGLFSLEVRERTFGQPTLIAGLQQATGLAAADVTGDGLLDLVVADAGDVSVYRAEWL